VKTFRVLEGLCKKCLNYTAIFSKFNGIKVQGSSENVKGKFLIVLEYFFHSRHWFIYSKIDFKDNK